MYYISHVTFRETEISRNKKQSISQNFAHEIFLLLHKPKGRNRKEIGVERGNEGWGETIDIRFRFLIPFFLGETESRAANRTKNLEGAPWIGCYLVMLIIN